MHYKTIVLELIQEQPGAVRAAPQRAGRCWRRWSDYAIELKAGHEAWKDRIGRTKPGGDPSQIASEALELAMRGATGPFALRIAAGRGGGDALARRGDGLSPPSHAARVSGGTRPIPASLSSPRPGSRRRHAPARRLPRRSPSSSGPARAILRDATAAAGRSTRLALRNGGEQGGKPPGSPMPFRPHPARDRRGSCSRPGGGRSLRRKAPAGGAANARRRPPHGRNRHDHRTARHRRAARKPRPATSSPPSARSRPSSSEQRPATAEERQALARFGGLRARGPLDLPRPGHRPVQGRRLAGPRRGAADRSSRPRNTTAPSAPPSTPSTPRPTVIAAMHEALARLGVPDDATVLEPGCGIGQFHEPGPGRACGSSASSWTRISGRIARALHPEPRHPHRELPRHAGCPRAASTP